MYIVLNGLTGKTVGKAKSLKGAIRIKDRKDNEYGACVHSYKKVQ